MELSVNGQPSMFVSGATITHRPQESHLYQDLGPAGGGSLTRSGVVIRALLMDAGLDPDHVSLLAVARPRGGSGYLYHADLAQLSDFPDGPALVSVDGKSTRFFRPQRTPDDQNAADDIATADGQPLAVSVYTGKLLKLTASHAPAHALRGQPVHFSAAASCCSLPGETLTYSWSLGDNSQLLQGPSIEHRFAAAGTYQAMVALLGSQGSVALPVASVVGVGSPRPASGHGAGGSGRRRSPTSGPVTGSVHGGSAHAGPGSGNGNGNGSSSTNLSPPQARASPPAAASSPTSPTTPTTAVRGPGHQVGGPMLPVSGVVLAEAGKLLASIGSPPPALPGAQPSARAGNPAGGATVPVGGALAFGIFAAGALYERRRPRGRST